MTVDKTIQPHLGILPLAVKKFARIQNFRDSRENLVKLAVKILSNYEPYFGISIL